MKKLIVLLCFVFAGMIVSCEKDESKLEEEPISGDSGLNVKNSSNLSANIFFDDKFIGSVENGKTRSWSVPSGSHKFEARISPYTPYTKTEYFSSGNTTEIELYIKTNK